MKLPRIAIVGRPNVGKSSLLNRFVGRRVSIVEPTAGVTRDRLSVALTWRDRKFELIDTGGLGLVDEAQLREHIESQIDIALEAADVILFVVDGKEGYVPGDQLVAQRLRRLDRPILLVANKVESRWDDYALHEWSKLGFGQPLPTSANEGVGITDLMDAMVERLPPAEDGEQEELDEGEDVVRFAVVGKRNSGKSTLINRLVGEERVIVSEIPGTTRDAVDVTFEHGGRKLCAIDTAGVRKKRSLADAIEFYSYTRATASIRRAHVVIHLFDVGEEISQVDKKICEYCIEHSKPVILVGNKIDKVEDLDLEKWDAYIKQQVVGLWFAPVSFISALEGENLDATLDLMLELREQARVKLPTSELNEVLQRAKTKLSPKNRGKIPKLFYGAQTGVDPLTLTIFVNEARLFRGQYDRYLQNRLREAFDCGEVPIRLQFRARQKVHLPPE